MDEDALEIARENIALVEMEDEIKLVHAQLPSRDSEDASIAKIDDPIPVFDPTKLDRKIDTVIMNPPFGTWNKVSLNVPDLWSNADFREQRESIWYFSKSQLR